MKKNIETRRVECWTDKPQNKLLIYVCFHPIIGLFIIAKVSRFAISVNNISVQSKKVSLALGSLERSNYVILYHNFMKRQGRMSWGVGGLRGSPQFWQSILKPRSGSPTLFPMGSQPPAQQKAGGKFVITKIQNSPCGLCINWGLAARRA